MLIGVLKVLKLGASIVASWVKPPPVKPVCHLGASSGSNCSTSHLILWVSPTDSTLSCSIVREGDPTDRHPASRLLKRETLQGFCQRSCASYEKHTLSYRSSGQPQAGISGEGEVLRANCN